jgi:hypothetical protein
VYVQREAIVNCDILNPMVSKSKLNSRKWVWFGDQSFICIES